MDTEVVTQLMVSKQLLSDDIVMAASSDYQKTCLILEQITLMNLQSLVSFTELLLACDGHYHIGKMLTDGKCIIISAMNAKIGNFIFAGLQSSLLSSTSGLQLSIDQKNTTIQHTEQKDMEESFMKNGNIDPSSVVTEFLYMKSQLEEFLQQCDPLLAVKKCRSLLASKTNKIPLFDPDYTKRLQEIKHIPELIQKLSPFMTWDNHSILSAIADTSNILEGTRLLTHFDNRIDSSQPLTSFPIPAPSQHMTPYDNSTHTILAVKLDLELYHSTLQNVIDARSLIQDQCKLTSYCLQLLALARTDLTIIYWMIPRSIAHLIAANALQFQNYYFQKGIIELAVYPGAVFCTASVLKVGPLSFLNQVEGDGKLVRIIL